MVKPNINGSGRILPDEWEQQGKSIQPSPKEREANNWRNNKIGHIGKESFEEYVFPLDTDKARELMCLKSSLKF